MGPTPTNVIERVKHLLDVQERGLANPLYSKLLPQAEDDCRLWIAKTCGAKVEEVALTHNTTEGLDIVLWSLDWKSGDEIVISDQEHPALMMPCYNLQSRFKVSYRRAAIDVGEDVVDNVIKQLTPQTRLVAMSHVSRQTGRVIPARELGRALHERGIHLLLDGAQAAGNVPVNFHDIGCDFYSLCSHKWLLGPKGAGAVLIRQNLLDSTPVSFTGAHGQKSYDQEGHFQWQPDGRRYEYGTRSQAVFGGFAEALRWLDGIGWNKIFNRIKEQSFRAAGRIKDSGKFSLVSPQETESQSGIVVLRLPEGSTGPDLYDTLLNRDRIVVSPLERPRDLRICLHFFNTWDEFEALMQRLEVYCRKS
jgi:selenocysteine lyase/cysteine desulfurase